VSTLIGPHIFVGALLSGIGILAILGLLTGRAGAPERHDLGKLLFGFSLFWAYLVFSQVLPIWYANLPEETGFLLRRTQSPWRSVSIAVVLFAFALPFLGLLHERAKRAPRVLGCLATVQLAGLWLERHLLVVPSVLRSGDPAVAVRDGLIALGTLAAFVLAVGRPLARTKPHAQEPQEHDCLIPLPEPRKR
jgi:Ni/Fe-hydrogenase subunit HybB-like protein